MNLEDSTPTNNSARCYLSCVLNVYALRRACTHPGGPATSGAHLPVEGQPQAGLANRFQGHLLRIGLCYRVLTSMSNSLGRGTDLRSDAAKIAGSFHGASWSASCADMKVGRSWADKIRRRMHLCTNLPACFCPPSAQQPSESPVWPLMR